MTDLSDFGGGAAIDQPTVTTKDLPIHIPSNGRMRHTGDVRTSPERGLVYLSPRDSAEHRYHKLPREGSPGAFAISESVFERIERNYPDGLAKVLIYEEDSKTVYEYRYDKFRDGGVVPEWCKPPEPQRYLPVAWAQYVWCDVGRSDLYVMPEGGWFADG